MSDETMRKVLFDYETAPIDDKLKSVLGLLSKMTLDDASPTAADVRAVLAKGVTNEAIAEALHIAYLFNIYDRLADTLGWDVPAVETGFYRTTAKILLKRGYR